MYFFEFKNAAGVFDEAHSDWLCRLRCGAAGKRPMSRNQPSPYFKRSNALPFS